MRVETVACRHWRRRQWRRRQCRRKALPPHATLPLIDHKQPTRYRHPVAPPKAAPVFSGACERLSQWLSACCTPRGAAAPLLRNRVQPSQPLRQTHRGKVSDSLRFSEAGSCHKRQKPQAPVRNRQTRKVANAKGLNRNTNLT